MCPENSKHKHGKDDKFCPKCGSPIEVTRRKKTRGMSPIHGLVNETDCDEIAHGTLGRGSIGELNQIAEGYPIFPEFMNGKLFLMLPGYTYKGDIGQEDGFELELSQNGRPFTAESLEAMNTYIALVKKVFDVQDVELKYGIIIEVI